MAFRGQHFATGRAYIGVRDFRAHAFVAFRSAKGDFDG
jgi:hypothetical protein